ncbi:MAG: HDOD domain-containing protein [Candidatus Latescibacteria bacterium]|nr:HDOD domain-containing protein [Candidatus Latescibacterota bacterium]
MTEEDVLRIMETAEDFPTLSTVATQIAQMTSDLQVPVSEVARLISMDVALSTKLLRLVNSSFYGLSGKVSEIPSGHQHPRLQEGRQPGPGPGRDGDLLQAHRHGIRPEALLGAVCLQCRGRGDHRIATSPHLPCRGLHRRVAAGHRVSLSGAVFPRRIQRGHRHGQGPQRPPRGRGAGVTGLDHAAVGALLSRHWKLPPIFEETIREHHCVELETDVSSSPLADTIRVINLSSLVTDACYEESKREKIFLLRERAHALFGLGKKSVDTLLEKVPKEFVEAASSFEITTRLKPPADEHEQADAVKALTKCPHCGAKGLGRFCVECGASLVRWSSRELSRRILIADDSVATRRALAFVIKKMGYEVVEAADGAEALDMARTHRPGLIILDIMMPVHS